MEDRDELREKLGLNDSAPVQFVRFVGNAAQRQFRPVATAPPSRSAA